MDEKDRLGIGGMDSSRSMDMKLPSTNEHS